MSLIENLRINTKLPISDDYKEEQKRNEFLDISFASNGSEYTYGKAPDGNIIVKMECEEENDYDNRRKVTPTRSYVSSILNKYNSSVFRNEPVRQATSPVIEQLFIDADGYGTPLCNLMRKSLLEAQKFESCYLLADSSATDTEILTIAQKNNSGNYPYIRMISSESIVDYEEIEDKLIEVIVLLEDENGVTFARWMNDSDFVDIELETKELRIKSISAPYAHGYSMIPLKEIEPLDDAQSLPIAHSQRTIVNTLSLLQQEMHDAVFSKYILSGVRIQEDDTATKKISWSGKRMVVLEDTNAKLDLLGADHGAADSLRKQIEVEEDNLYKSAGLNNPNVPPTNISGYALRINQDSFFTICSQLKNSIESAENYILELICEKEGVSFVPTVYSDKFIADDDSAGLLALRDTLALDLPATFKRLAVRSYIQTFYNIGEEDQVTLEAELMQMYGAVPQPDANIV